MAETFRTSLAEAGRDRNLRELEGASRFSSAGKGLQIEKRSDAAETFALTASRSASSSSVHDAPGVGPARQSARPSGPEAVESAMNLNSYPDKPIRIAIKSKGKILLINPVDVLAVEADGNYVSLLLASGSHILRESISSMAERLKRYGFIRVHRSVIVNASSVEEISPGTTGEYILHIAGGRQYVVSRTYRHNLKHLAHSWIGLDSFVAD